MLDVAFRLAFPGLELDVAFQAPGGVTALFGPSGCGKTTTINAVAGLVRPDSGRIAVGGRVLFDAGADLPPQARRIGYVFQDARLFPHMTVAANLRYPSRWRRGAGRDFDRVIGMLALEPLLARRPGTLSGGERQRVAVARALAHDPAILLADEPTASLDRAAADALIADLAALARDEGRTVVIVSHDAHVWAAMDRVLTIHDGRLLDDAHG